MNQKTYTNGEVTVVWKPGNCIHSKKCWTGLGEVFNPRERPWIKMDGAGSERIIEQIKECPSGALSYRMNEPGEHVAREGEDYTEVEVSIQVLENGPLMVKGGGFLITGVDGTSFDKQEAVALCRCGGSSSKPFCDGTHAKNGFKG